MTLSKYTYSDKIFFKSNNIYLFALSNLLIDHDLSNIEL